MYLLLTKYIKYVKSHEIILKYNLVIRIYQNHHTHRKRPYAKSARKNTDTVGLYQICNSYFNTGTGISEFKWNTWYYGLHVLQINVNISI